MNYVVGLILIGILVYCVWSAVDYSLHPEDFEDESDDTTE